MQVFRLFAYAVNPQRTVPTDEREAPIGGDINMDAALRGALDAALAKAQSRLSSVVLNVDPTNGSRSNPVRDSALEVAFAAKSPTAERQALALATRLSESMDRRSDPGLLLVAAYRDGTTTPRRRVALWLFPRGEGFRFRRQRIELVRDYFDRNSTQRKLALFAGRNAKGQFLRASVLDLQAGSGEVADLWVRYFLDAGPAITKENGTRMIAKALKELSARSLPVDERDQILSAVMSLRTTPIDRWSMDAVANQFLSGDLKQRFLDRAPNPASRQSQFDLDRTLFEQVLNFRQWLLDNGIVVYSPLGEVGRGARVVPSDGAAADGERLEVSGGIVDDRLTQRRGR